MRWHGVVTTTIVLSLLAFAVPARAGTYDVWGCRLPDGTSVGAGGWRPSGNSPGAQDLCSSAGGGGLESFLSTGTLADWQQAGWTFFAPPDTEIDGFTLRRAATVPGDRAYYLFGEVRPETSFVPAQSKIEACVNWYGVCPGIGDLGHPAAVANTITRDRLTGIFGLTAVVACHPYSTPSCDPAPAGSYVHAVIWSSRIGLKDVVGPGFIGPPSGTLFSGKAPVAGIATVSLAAVDRGGGVQSVTLIVDGSPGESQPADPDNAGCRPPYVTPVPCSSSVDRTFSFDTGRFRDGVHTVRVAVTDVAGNTAQSGAYTVVTRNASVPNGVNASRAARLEAWFRSNRARGAVATVGFNARRTVEGRVATADGRPIGAAVLQASVQAMRPGSRVRSLGNIVTDAEGRFRFVLPRGSSREVHLGYRADTFDEQEAAGATLSLNVRAGVRLTVTPRRVRNGTTATFSGRLLGGPGQFGTQVTIYALGGRRPIPVETVPADRRGRFRYRYRFSSISGRGGFRFRAVVKSQPNYPYASGGSRAVTVRARP